MATQYRSFEITIPTGSTRAAPVIFPMIFPSFVVLSIDVYVPPGPLGQMGFQIASSRQQVIPWNAGQWIVANADYLTFPVTDAPNSGDWQLIAYNTGAFPHTIWVRFALDPIPLPVTPVVTITTADLSTALPEQVAP